MHRIARLIQRPQQTLLLIGLAAVLVLTGLYTIHGVGMDASALEMTAMPADMLMAPAIWTLGYALVVFFMWWIMMAAMMIPAASPMILLFAALRRRQAPSGVLLATTVFVGGYLLAWGVFSAAATMLQYLLQSAGALSPMMLIGDRVLGGLVLVVAGLYQFTPWKLVCLSKCQNPVRFMVAHRGQGRFANLRLGLSHGTFCVGCCLFLMSLLFVGGVMNLYWIAGLAVYVLLERWMARHRWLGRSAGAALTAAGVLMAASAIEA